MIKRLKFNGMKILFVINDPPTPLIDKYNGLPGMVRTALDQLKQSRPDLIPESLSNINGSDLDIKEIHAYKHRFDKKETLQLFPSVQIEKEEGEKEEEEEEEIKTAEDFKKKYDVDCVLLSGSLYNATDMEPWMQAEAEWLRIVVNKLKVKVLGICFGIQILAQALGGKVEFFPKEGEWGSHEIFLNLDNRNKNKSEQEEEQTKEEEEEDPIFGWIPDKVGRSSITCQITHSQTVMQLPSSSSSASSLGYSKASPNHIIRYSENCVACQFHPEYRVPYVKEVLAADIESGENYPFQKEEEDISAVFLVAFLAWVADGKN